MASKYNDEQRANGARAIAYRVEQLTDVTMSLRQPHPLVIRRALIDSALVNARVLGWFFTRPQDVHYSLYGDKPDDDALLVVAGLVEEPVSRHAGHGTVGAKTGELHPGAWPIPELAAVLVGGVARFVERLDAPERDWFAQRLGAYGIIAGPPPSAYDAGLIVVGAAQTRTEVSLNPSVGALTRGLQEYIAGGPGGVDD
jgi:hypothetical protein